MAGPPGLRVSVSMPSLVSAPRHVCACVHLPRHAPVLTSVFVCVCASTQHTPVYVCLWMCVCLCTETQRPLWAPGLSLSAAR